MRSMPAWDTAVGIRNRLSRCLSQPSVNAAVVQTERPFLKKVDLKGAVLRSVDVQGAGMNRIGKGYFQISIRKNVRTGARFPRVDSKSVRLLLETEMTDGVSPLCIARTNAYEVHIPRGNFRRGAHAGDRQEPFGAVPKIDDRLSDPLSFFQIANVVEIPTGKTHLDSSVLLRPLSPLRNGNANAHAGGA